MTTITTIVIFLAAYLALYFCFGSFLYIGRRKKMDLTMSMIIGFFIFYGIFQLITLPMVIMLQPLSLLARIWLSVCSVVALAAVIIFARGWVRVIHQTFKQRFYKNPFIWLVFLLVLCQVAYVLLFEHSSMDAVYYVGDVSTSVYTDSLGRFDPYSGKPLVTLSTRYLLSTYPFNDAVFSQTFGVHPLIMVKQVMSAVVIILSNLLYYNIGKRLFKGDNRKAALMVVFAFFINIFNYSPYTSSAFMFLRTYEGKSILPNIILPAIFYLFIRLLDDYKDKLNWIALFLISWSSCSLTMSSMIVVPVSIGTFIFPMTLLKKDYKGIWKVIVCVSPSILVFAYYLLTTRGGLTFPAQP